MNLKFSDFMPEINKFIVKKAIVFYGPNIGKIDDCVRQTILQKRQINQKFDIIHKYSDELKLGDVKKIINQNRSLDLFGNTALIVFHLSNEKLSKEIIESINEIKDKDIKIIVRTGPLRVNSLLRKHFEKTNELLIVPCYEESSFEKKKLISDFFKKKKIAVSENFKTILSDHLSNHRVEIREKLDKIELLASGKNVKIEQLNIFYDSAYSDELEFINSLVSGRIDSRFNKQLDQLCQFNNEQIRCASILLEHFYKLLKVKVLLKEGLTLSQAQSSLKPPIFFKHKYDFEKQLAIWEIKNLESIIKRLALSKIKFFRGEVNASSFFLGCILKIVKIKTTIS